MSKKQALSKEELKKINGGTPGTGDIATGPKGSGKKCGKLLYISLLDCLTVNSN